MRFYQRTTEFNCGIDLHTRQMYVCVMDRQGHKLLHTNVPEMERFFSSMFSTAWEIGLVKSFKSFLFFRSVCPTNSVLS